MQTGAWLLIAVPALSAPILLLTRQARRQVGPPAGPSSRSRCSSTPSCCSSRSRDRATGIVEQHLFSWIPVGGFQVEAGLLIDPLALVFALLITGVGSLIHIYAVGYMAHDPGRRRFFGYFNLFVAAMLLLVLANSYLALYVGWEGVGVASYLLISYYFNRNSAATAGNKAFFANRVGDVGLSVAIMLMFAYTGSTGFDQVLATARR